MSSLSSHDENIVCAKIINYPVQYDLFKTKEISEMEALEKRIAVVEKSSDKVRKGTYARIGKQDKIISELESRLEILERFICRG